VTLAYAPGRCHIIPRRDPSPEPGPSLSPPPESLSWPLAMSPAFSIPPGLDASKLSKDVSAYSDLQLERLTFTPPLPQVLTAPCTVVKGPPTSSAGNEGQKRTRMPSLCSSLLPHCRNPCHSRNL